MVIALMRNLIPKSFMEMVRGLMILFGIAMAMTM